MQPVSMLRCRSFLTWPGADALSCRSESVVGLAIRARCGSSVSDVGVADRSTRPAPFRWYGVCSGYISAESCLLIVVSAVSGSGIVLFLDAAGGSVVHGHEPS